jgi:hypothetical protein
LKGILLVVLVLVVLVALAAGGWWLSRGKEPAPVVAVGPSVSSTTTQVPAPAHAENRLTLPPVEPEPGDLATSVVFPLEVEIELVHADETLHAEGAPALGSGAKAQIKGTILGPKRAPVRAEIEFEAGPNQGRVLYCDSSGAFGAQDLYPGLNIVRVSGPGIVGSQREVRLRQEREELLNISYGLPAHVVGNVFDAQSKPLAGAEVSFDGQKVATDENGLFDVPAVAAGNVLVVVSKPGYAAYRETVTVGLNGKPEALHLQYRLDPGARLQVSVLDAINRSEDARVYILPSDSAAQRKFPWHTKSPQYVKPGGTWTIEDLPAGMVSLRLFHAGAKAKPEQQNVMLGAGDTASAEFHLEPAPVLQGVVTDGGKPATGVAVVLEAPDRAKAMLSVLGESNYLFLENEVFPNLPPAEQMVRTNGLGEFVLNANESAGAVRYVTATSEDGRRAAHAVVQAGATRVDLALEEVAGGKGVLRLVLPGREQPLPLKITVNGTPRDQRMLPLGRELTIADLPRGSWLVSARWNGEALLQRSPVKLDGEVEVEVQLPVGAKLGQDAETMLRSGRH